VEAAGEYIPAVFMTLTSLPGALNKNDFGKYSCVAEGEDASASADIELQLEKRP